MNFVSACEDEEAARQILFFRRLSSFNFDNYPVRSKIYLMSLLIMNLASPFLNYLKRLVTGIEFKKFKDAVRRNPNDHLLRVRFAKFCLNHYFSQRGNSKQHGIEAVNQFENINHSEVMDLEVYYLMGKYYQGQDNAKAISIYRKGITRYNEYSQKNLDFRHEYVELAFSIALNLLHLENNEADPELEKFFKVIRRTYLKRFFDEKMGFGPEILGSSHGDVRPIAN